MGIAIPLAKTGKGSRTGNLSPGPIPAARYLWTDLFICLVIMVIKIYIFNTTLYRIRGFPWDLRKIEIQ